MQRNKAAIMAKSLVYVLSLMSDFEPEVDASTSDHYLILITRFNFSIQDLENLSVFRCFYASLTFDYLVCSHIWLIFYQGIEFYFGNHLPEGS